jgi:uncharacterized protein (TIGR00255 family)
MVLSMTGFATKIVTLQLEKDAKVNLTINLKSLNSRFFETTFKLPYAVANLETELIKILKKRLVRGHIYCTMHLDNQSLLKGSIEPSMPIVTGYYRATQVIKEQLKIEGALTLSDLLQLPDVFVMGEKELSPQIAQKIYEEFNGIVDALLETKGQEGATLAKDMLQRVAIMEKEITQIEAAYRILLEEQKQKVNQAVQMVEGDESKFATARKDALYTMLDKLDIHEEIVRFRSHVKSLTTQLESSEFEKGKRLDFTLQEMGREINTISAKCADATIGSHAINVKVEVEKTREQAQNIV